MSVQPPRWTSWMLWEPATASMQASCIGSCVAAICKVAWPPETLPVRSRLRGLEARRHFEMRSIGTASCRAIVRWPYPQEKHFTWLVIASDALRIKGRRHVAGDAQLEVIFRAKPAESCGCQMQVVFTRLGKSMLHLTALQAHAVAEIPVIREHRIAAPVVGRKRKRGSRIPGGRVVRRHGGSNCGNVGIDYFQYP